MKYLALFTVLLAVFYTIILFASGRLEVIFQAVIMSFAFMLGSFIVDAIVFTYGTKK